ncbi:MAG: hypothetical protein OXF94_01170 [Gammaproteobacteria bacterium]|nr:hypothetical protein [Gammaproteobacteria bacterium]
MKTVIRGMTVAALLWGGILAGEAQAACGGVTPNMYAPYICKVTRQAPGSAVQQTTETVTWRVTFSEPVTGVGWDDFYIEDARDQVPGSSPVRYYGTGSSDLISSKVDRRNYDFSFEWDCTTSGNDCEHNYDNPMVSCGDDCTRTNPDSAERTDRYVGRVSLELQTGPTWQRDSSSSETGTASRDNNMANNYFEVK